MQDAREIDGAGRGVFLRDDVTGLHAGQIGEILHQITLDVRGETGGQYQRFLLLLNGTVFAGVQQMKPSFEVLQLEIEIAAIASEAANGSAILHLDADEGVARSDARIGLRQRSRISTTFISCPTSERSGPTARPRPMTMWHVAHFPASS